MYALFIKRVYRREDNIYVAYLEMDKCGHKSFNKQIYINIYISPYIPMYIPIRAWEILKNLEVLVCLMTHQDISNTFTMTKT